jgi:large subunit ribosomal protein L21
VPEPILGYTQGSIITGEETMYAVIESGGKQHRVVAGETLKLEKLDIAAGKTIKFDKVMLVANGDDIQIGTPYVKGAKVSAEVLSHGRGDKITVIKFNRRKNYRRQSGHRQWYTEVKITDIPGSKEDGS